jgi:integrase/recombinase XerD
MRRELNLPEPLVEVTTGPRTQAPSVHLDPVAPEALVPFELGEFAGYCRLAHAKGTEQSYVGIATRFATFVVGRGSPTPADVKRADITEYLRLLHRHRQSAGTIRSQVGAIRAYYHFLIEGGTASVDPTESIELPKLPRRLPHVLSVSEVKALIDVVSLDQPLALRDRAMIELAYGAGLRVSELTGLELRGTELSESTVRVFGKGSKERRVPIGAAAVGAISSYLHWLRPRLDRGESRGKLLLGLSGRPMCTVSVAQILRKYARIAGLGKHVSPHMLRHSFATHLLQNGAPLLAVKEMLGHESVTTTQIYTHVDRTYVTRVHRESHPRS